MLVSQPDSAESTAPSQGAPDEFEALYNDGAVGPAAAIQRPLECITRSHGFRFDLDPVMLRPGNPLFPPDSDPRLFHDLIRPVLDRHPLARHAEVRLSGTGLHLIVRLDPAAELTSRADQVRWSDLVRAVLSSLPVDPHAPGITGLTRRVGSVNSKNGVIVEVLRQGDPVSPDQVAEFVQDLAAAPFRVVAGILGGPEPIRPCPACRTPGSSLGVHDRSGHCYDCGQVDLTHLYESILVDSESVAPSVEADGDPTTVPARGSRPRRPRPKMARRGQAAL
jgi:hypothetical protein